MSKNNLTLDELFGEGAIIKASEAKAKRKAAEFIPEALVTFVVEQECKRCGARYEAPQYASNSTFIRGRVFKEEGQESREYRQHYGGFDNLPTETLVKRTSIAKCHKCVNQPNGEDNEPWHPLMRGERQFYHHLLTGGDREKLIRKEEQLGYEIAEEVWEYLQ